MNKKIEKLANEYAEIHFRKDINLFGNVVADFKAGYLKGVESLREENEKLRKQVEIAKESLHKMYGVPLLTSRHDILKQALEEIERVGK